MEIDRRAEIQTAMALILSDAEAFALAEEMAADPDNEVKKNKLADRLKALESAKAVGPNLKEPRT